MSCKGGWLAAAACFSYFASAWRDCLYGGWDQIKVWWRVDSFHVKLSQFQKRQLRSNEIECIAFEISKSLFIFMGI